MIVNRRELVLGGISTACVAGLGLAPSSANAVGFWSAAGTMLFDTLKEFAPKVLSEIGYNALVSYFSSSSLVSPKEPIVNDFHASFQPQVNIVVPNSGGLAFQAKPRKPNIIVHNKVHIAPKINVPRRKHEVNTVEIHGISKGNDFRIRGRGQDLVSVPVSLRREPFPVELAEFCRLREIHGFPDGYCDYVRTMVLFDDCGCPLGFQTGFGWAPFPSKAPDLRVFDIVDGACPEARNQMLLDRA